MHIELWKCDLLKVTTDDAPDEDRTGNPSAKSLMRYQLRLSAPQLIRHIVDVFKVSTKRSCSTFHGHTSGHKICSVCKAQNAKNNI